MAIPDLARTAAGRLRRAKPGGRPSLGDFTIDPRVLPLIAMALVVGTTGAGSAWLLVKLIALVTNLAYYGRLTTLTLPIAGTPLGPLAALVPVAGCLIIGLMARFGSEKIRGHGIPEAMEAILIGSSRIEPKVAAAEAALLGDLHRHRRSLRRRGADHHDGRGSGLALRPALSSERRRAQDPARRRRRRGHDRHLRHARRGRAPGGGAAALRMEAAELHTRRHRGGSRRGLAAAAVRRGTALSLRRRSRTSPGGGSGFASPWAFWPGSVPAC